MCVCLDWDGGVARFATTTGTAPLFYCLRTVICFRIIAVAVSANRLLGLRLFSRTLPFVFPSFSPHRIRVRPPIQAVPLPIPPNNRVLVSRPAQIRGVSLRIWLDFGGFLIQFLCRRVWSGRWRSGVDLEGRFLSCLAAAGEAPACQPCLKSKASRGTTVCSSRCCVGVMLRSAHQQ